VKENKQEKGLWPELEQLEKTREELRKKLLHEELECALRLEIVDRLMTDLKVDPTSFRKLWIQPLIAAGVTLDVALLCIAQSHHQPN